MPVLKKIVVSDFRNIEFQEIFFTPNINCISGNNGEGKTNLLDAIHYLSMTRSSLTTSDRYNFRYGKNVFSVSGVYVMDNGTESRFSVQVTAGGEKKVKCDGHQYERISEHIGVLPVVMVSPSDISLVSESGEERRRFVNSVLSQTDRGYLSDMQQYNRLLQQRNRLLKENGLDVSLIDVIDGRMSVFADRIYKARKVFAGRLAPVVADFYKTLSGGTETVSIAYRSDLDKGSLADILSSNLDKDRILRYTTSGIQRDEFVFSMGDVPIRRCGSQGQQKSFLVSLKFAQYRIMKDIYSFSPILLLDDVFDKLDMGRVSNLLAMVSGSEFGQIFITDSNKVRMASIVDRLTEDRAYFETSSGVFTRI